MKAGILPEDPLVPVDVEDALSRAQDGVLPVRRDCQGREDIPTGGNVTPPVPLPELSSFCTVKGEDTSIGEDNAPVSRDGDRRTPLGIPGKVYGKGAAREKDGKEESEGDGVVAHSSDGPLCNQYSLPPAKGGIDPRAPCCDGEIVSDS